MTALQQPSPAPLRVAIAGFGAIGSKVAKALNDGIPGCELVAVSARDHARVTAEVAGFRNSVIVTDLNSLEPLADIVVECAPSELLPRILTPFLRAGKRAIVLGVGALLGHDELVALARQHRGQIIVPTGALIGLDAVTAAAEGTIHSVRMISRKPVRGLLGAPYLVRNKIEIEGITAPLRVFSGTAREAAIGFPANLNVVAALALAGIGPERTTIEVWADPGVQRNIHRIEVDADSASFSMSIENIPSENPKTGRITALSAISYLRKLGAPLRVGS
ncbi:MAG TPA: aspartate dehydrogenase [Xanthobacteraceae bacterium]|jgi:aspartate dehydrogenase